MTCSIIVRAAIISSFHIVSASSLLALSSFLSVVVTGKGSGISGFVQDRQYPPCFLVGPPVPLYLILFIFAVGPRSKCPSGGQPAGPIPIFVSRIT